MKKRSRKKVTTSKEAETIPVQWVCKTCGYHSQREKAAVTVAFGNVSLQGLCPNCFGHWWEHQLADVPRMVIEPVKKKAPKKRK